MIEDRHVLTSFCARVIIPKMEHLKLFKIYLFYSSVLCKKKNVYEVHFSYVVPVFTKKLFELPEFIKLGVLPNLLTVKL